MSNDLFFWFRDGRCPAHSPEVLLTAVRTFTRSAAVIGAATALTFAGAGAAMAATTHEVEGNLLSVTFTQDHWLDGALCFAVAVPTAGAAGVVSQARMPPRATSGLSSTSSRAIPPSLRSPPTRAVTEPASV